MVVVEINPEINDDLDPPTDSPVMEIPKTEINLTMPHTWFNNARAMRRKITYYAGPTNSGKTYHALQNFWLAESGIYCAPLRLLAIEVMEKSVSQGVACSLRTGEARVETPQATHLSCTIELADLERSQPWSIAVIDEIQLIGDEQRGSSWTRVLLGLNASSICLCGDESAIELVRSICDTTGDEFEAVLCSRDTPLVVEENALGGAVNVVPGDCVVVFSRKDIFSLKSEIERSTNLRCCMVYGALPPETRTKQAKRFNDPDSGFDVMVATNAIGLGLNLEIRRIILRSVRKYNGREVAPLSPSEVKQIAGRAGRRGGRYSDQGLVTTWYGEDIAYLRKCMELPVIGIPKAGLFPSFAQIEELGQKLAADLKKTPSLYEVLVHVERGCHLDGSYFLSQSGESMKSVARCAGDYIKELSLQEQYFFSMAPFNVDREWWLIDRVAKCYTERKPIELACLSLQTEDDIEDDEFYEPSTSDLMFIHEKNYQKLMIYLWLSEHLGRAELFKDKDKAEKQASEIGNQLHALLSD